MTIEKVREDDLCRPCEADRRSLYYHFKDKHDMIARALKRDYDSSVSEIGGNPVSPFWAAGF